MIELLTIIVILAIIAVITVPLILNIIEDSKKGAAQDSSYGYKNAIEKLTLEKMTKDHNFKLENKTYTTEELKNIGLNVNGKEPENGEIEIEQNIIKSFTLQFDNYTCTYPVNKKVECQTGKMIKIKEINLESTSNSITVTVTVNTIKEYYYKIENEEFIKTNTYTYTFNNLEESKEYEITIKVISDEGKTTQSRKISTKGLPVGLAITYGGYNWHVIRNYEENGQKYQTLLMDASQLGKMNHCTEDTDPNTDCGYNGSYYVYSWDKSKIQTYLNNDFINQLKNDDVDISKIKEEQVCVDPSIGGGSDYSYGGFLKEEVVTVDGNCTTYKPYKIRLITASEYYNLSYYYRDIQLPYEVANGSGNSMKFAKLDGIKRVSSEHSWLYSAYMSAWWSMSSYSNASTYYVKYARFVSNDGHLYYYSGRNSQGVRPVIAIAK